MPSYGGGRKPAASSCLLSLGAHYLVDERLGRLLLVAVRDHRDLVLDRRLRALGQVDDGDVLACDGRVGRVDEAGVGFPERDLVDDCLDVVLVRHDVVESRVEPELRQDLARVVPDGDALGRDRRA